MSIHKAKSKKPKTLAEILLITWFCSLLWGGGMLFAAGNFIFIFWLDYAIIYLFSSLAVSFLSLVLLGASITSDRMRRVKAGLLSLLAGLSSIILIWIGLSALWISNWPYHFEASLGISLIACVTITTFILLIDMHQYRRRELIVGIIISIGISVIDEVILGKSLLKNRESYLIWQIPSLVWVSVVYFAELLARRSKLKDFFVWAILVLISFGLPFFIAYYYPNYFNNR